MPAKNIYTPFTYLIGWSILDKYYYGVRFAKNCQPDDLWTTYFTSSKIVSEYRTLYGEPDIIKIRKTFNTKEEAILWEQKLLNKINVRDNPYFLNSACIKEHWCLNSGIPHNKNKPMSEEQKSKISKTRKDKNLGKKSAKYLPKMFGDDNPMRRDDVREFFSKRITGRKRKYNDDGSWNWYYPNSK